jgi:hypothetical protein
LGTRIYMAVRHSTENQIPKLLGNDSPVGSAHLLDQFLIPSCSTYYVTWRYWWVGLQLYTTWRMFCITRFAAYVRFTAVDIQGICCQIKRRQLRWPFRFGHGVDQVCITLFSRPLCNGSLWGHHPISLEKTTKYFKRLTSAAEKFPSSLFGSIPWVRCLSG